MGQSSTFLTNRQGDFQFWNDIWDSKESFQKSNLENILIKNCLSVFLKNKNYVNWRFFFFKNLNFWSDSFFLSLNPHLLEEYWIEHKDIKKNNISVITCFIFKYQGWLIFFIYYHVVRKFVSNKKKIEENLNEDSLNVQESNKNLNENNTDIDEKIEIAPNQTNFLNYKGLVENFILNKNNTLLNFDSSSFEDELDTLESNFEELLNSEIDFEYFSDEELEDLNQTNSDFDDNFSENKKKNYYLSYQTDFLKNVNEPEIELDIIKEEDVFGNYNSLDSIDYDDEDSYTLNCLDPKNKEITKNGELPDLEKEDSTDDENEPVDEKKKQLFYDSDSDSDDYDDDELFGKYYYSFNSPENNFNTFSDFF